MCMNVCCETKDKFVVLQIYKSQCSYSWQSMVAHIASHLILFPEPQEALLKIPLLTTVHAIIHVSHHCYRHSLKLVWCTSCTNIAQSSSHEGM